MATNHPQDPLRPEHQPEQVGTDRPRQNVGNPDPNLGKGDETTGRRNRGSDEQGNPQGQGNRSKQGGKQQPGRRESNSLESGEAQPPSPAGGRRDPQERR
jgi:hypothetical protein